MRPLRFVRIPEHADMYFLENCWQACACCIEIHKRLHMFDTGRSKGIYQVAEQDVVVLQGAHLLDQ